MIKAGFHQWVLRNKQRLAWNRHIHPSTKTMFASAISWLGFFADWGVFSPALTSCLWTKDLLLLFCRELSIWFCTDWNMIGGQQQGLGLVNSCWFVFAADWQVPDPRIHWVKAAQKQRFALLWLVTVNKTFNFHRAGVICWCKLLILTGS